MSALPSIMTSIPFTLENHVNKVVISVGYDDKKMLLKGKFSYEKENQRTLPFNVDIVSLPEYKTVFAGSSSKCLKCF